MSPWQASLRSALRAALRLDESSGTLVDGPRGAPPDAGKRRWFDAELVHRPAVVQVVAVRLSVSSGVCECAHQAQVSLLVVTIGLQDPEQVRDRGIRIGGVPREEAEGRYIRRTGFFANRHRPVVIGVLLEEVAGVDGG